ncbi:MAG: hypothetical protein M1819_005568 [Sarea resinae]|nr:MAG: hypothetical protein M1819_005568 [Sarea resinae]
MVSETQAEKRAKAKSTDRISSGIGAGPGGLATKGRYVPLNPKNTEVGWGVVHLYRDAEETPSLHDDDSANRKGSTQAKGGDGVGEGKSFDEKDCTTLCILAVPSYLTPSDFLGFVGEKTRDEVTHFRMIRTGATNRYMVLMKFRSAKKAKEWRKEYNGKVFNSMEPENCHVVFVKSITFETPSPTADPSNFPDMTHDPFTPAIRKQNQAASLTPGTSSAGGPTPLTPASLTTKPLAPPTPSLIELPTCPVCLERMDETTGLLTILCQHVFHCACLQKWRGGGCPVCRYTQGDAISGKRAHGLDDELRGNECSVCGSEANLWICLICGNIGCGRYDEAHAFAHYQQTSHCYAMDVETQRVWDYAGDGYVHRLIQTKSDGKLVELPSALNNTAANNSNSNSALSGTVEDYVPREKLDNIGMEYAYLLTSQLDSQRLYFEEKVERAADKASQAAATAEKAAAAATKASHDLSLLQSDHAHLLESTIPALERDRARAERKAEKFETMARKMEKEWREEKAMNGSLMEKIKHLNREMEALKVGCEEKGKEVEALKEENRDLSFFISGTERLKGEGEDIVEGTVSVPGPPAPSKKGKKGKGKK